MSLKPLVISFTTLTCVLLASASAMAQEPPPGYAAPPPYAEPAPQPYAAPPPYGAAQPGYPPPGYGPPVAYAAPVTPPGYHEHDGFYLRLVGGLGYLHNSASYQGDSMKISGVAGTFGIAAGGIVARNLAIYGEITGASVTDPSVEFNGQSRTANGTTVGMFGFGPGLTYYLENNAYLSASLLFTQLTMTDTDTGDKAETNIGFGGSVSGGKEWWISDNWGIGVAGQIMLGSMKEKDFDYRWTGMAFSLLFSATYN